MQASNQLGFGVAAITHTALFERLESSSWLIQAPAALLGENIRQGSDPLKALGLHFLIF